MAKCLDCNQEMDVDTCTCNVLVLAENDGRIISRHERSTYHFDEPDGRCNDCGIKHGGIHHLGCDVERCPICGLQLIGCGCWKNHQIEARQISVEDMERLEVKKPVEQVSFRGKEFHLTDLSIVTEKPEDFERELVELCRLYTVPSISVNMTVKGRPGVIRVTK